MTGPSTPPFQWTTRVYWEDTDAGGVVYYANYLKFLERARTEWLRERGHDQIALARDHGLLFVVVRVEVDYRAAARLDDLLQVSCEPLEFSRVAVEFRQVIDRQDGASQRLLEARLRAACVDARSLKPRRIPEFIR